METTIQSSKIMSWFDLGFKSLYHQGYFYMDSKPDENQGHSSKLIMCNTQHNDDRLGMQVFPV